MATNAFSWWLQSLLLADSWICLAVIRNFAKYRLQLVNLIGYATCILWSTSRLGVESCCFSR